MIAEIYGWFTKDFDIADLKDASRCSTSWEHRNALLQVRDRKSRGAKVL